MQNLLEIFVRATKLGYFVTFFQSMLNHHREKTVTGKIQSNFFVTREHTHQKAERVNIRVARFLRVLDRIGDDSSKFAAMPDGISKSTLHGYSVYYGDILQNVHV